MNTNCFSPKPFRRVMQKAVARRACSHFGTSRQLGFAPSSSVLSSCSRSFFVAASCLMANFTLSRPRT